MARVDPEDTIARLREELEEARAERDASRRVIIRLKAKSKAARANARRNADARERYIDELQRGIERANDSIGKHLTKLHAVEDAHRKTADELKARTREASELLTEVRALRQRVGIPGGASVLNAPGSIADFRAGLLALTHRLGLPSPVPAKDGPGRPQHVAPDVNRFVQSLFEVEARVGQILDIAAKAATSPTWAAEEFAKLGYGGGS